MFLVVLGISPQGFLEDLHSYILYSCVCLRNCLYVVTEMKFNSIKFKDDISIKTAACEVMVTDHHWILCYPDMPAKSF